MHFERLLLTNVRHLDDREYDFTLGPGRLRRWNLLPAGVATSTLLRSLALAGLGRRQLQGLTEQFPLELADRAEQPVHLEFVQVRHALQEREATSPVRRHLGWWGGEGAASRFEPWRKEYTPAGRAASTTSSTR